ncbi:AraC family transcriptional regulator [Allohahella marinimesophila]|uniref:AraC family transcriptional regulator n=1 Tax=Allohahella marinimesophila TaxID=1054972 RepID=A0ABP7NTE3_9GAMM
MGVTDQNLRQLIAPVSARGRAAAHKAEVSAAATGGMLVAEVVRLPQHVNRHSHPYHQLVMGLTGTAEIDMLGLAAHLDVSHACVVPSNTYHDFYGRPSNHVLVINIDADSPVFTDQAHPDHASLATLFDRPRLISLDNGMRQLTQVSIQEIQRNPHDRALRHYLGSAIIRCLSQRLLPSTSQHERGLLDMYKIDNYIFEHLDETISIADLAACLCLSERRFHGIFKAQMQQTPHQYIIDQRLDKAIQLITNTSLSLIEISELCGFSSQSALTSSVRKYRGTTPGRLRNG